ncbi:MAG: hypothetical protein U0793_25220 [Gemmataceae bacterium]
MKCSPVGTRFLAAALSLALVFGLARLGMSAPTACEIRIESIDDLKRLSPAELGELFAQGDLATIPNGKLEGAVLYKPNRFGKLKVWGANLFWRGKILCDDTSFVNHWIGAKEWLSSHYEIAPSWTDGKPALILQYPKGTPLFENLRDEMRCVGPGLFLAVAYQRCPAPCFDGYLAIQEPRCDGHKLHLRCKH